MNTVRLRRAIGFFIILIGFGFAMYQSYAAQPSATNTHNVPQNGATHGNGTMALSVLETLPVKGRAPKTGYSRQQFGNGWSTISGCDMRNIILHRDLIDAVVSDDCNIMSGKLNDPYTGKLIDFQRGEQTSDDIQIDHVVALSNAWQTGAQQLSLSERTALANDPLELVAVDGQANQAKGDGDAATWLPPNKAFRCQYAARQIAVKSKYKLWVTQPERDAMRRVLSGCPEQQLPVSQQSVTENKKATS